MSVGIQRTTSIETISHDVRAEVQEIGFPLTFKALKCIISYLLAKCLGDK
jgi:hypothetical protein